MSSPKTTTITCPKCKNQQSFTMWESLNSNLDPDKKKQLLSGALTRFACTRCQASCDVAYPMLYHDMEHRLMVYYTARTKDPQMGGLPFGAMLQGYTLRLVTERHELLEKILLLDARLNDRAMELFKVSVRSQMEEAEAGELVFAGLGQTPQRQALVNFNNYAKQGVNPVSVARESYDDFAQGVAELLENEPLPAGKWSHVNREYAENLIRKYMPDRGE
jgi:CpXC protein